MPIETLPEALQWVASWNPISVLVAAVRELFGNPVTPVTKDVWPMVHPVAASLALLPADPRRSRSRPPCAAIAIRTTD